MKCIDFLKKVLLFFRNLFRQKKNEEPYQDSADTKEEMSVSEPETRTGEFYDQSIEEENYSYSYNNTFETNSESEESDLITYFLINKKVGITELSGMEYVKYYSDKLLALENMRNCIIRNPDVNFSVISRHLDVYCRLMNKKLEMLSERLRGENEMNVQEIFIIPVFDCISSNLISKIVPNIRNNISESDRSKAYAEFLSVFNSFLSELNIYTFEPCKKSEHMKEHYYELYEVDTIMNSDPRYSEIIKEIERLPYAIDYTDGRGQRTSIHCNGKLIMYVSNNLE